MSNTSTGNNTMSKTTPAPKRVSKKTDAPTVATATTPAAAPAVEKKEKRSKPVVAATATTDAPVATAVTETAPKVELSVEQEIAALIKTHEQLKKDSTEAIKTLQRLQKRVAKEVKEAGKRKRRSKKEGEDGAPKEKRPTIFTTPVTLKDELCAFLGKAKGTQMTPADVTRAFSAYVEAHKLKDAEKGHTIHPDAAMRKVLGIKEGEPISYKNIQRYLYKLYVLPEKKKVATA
jgi:chromatin remodeling complex protein RSC6